MVARTIVVLAVLGLSLGGPALAGSAADFARNFGRMAAPGLPGYGTSRSGAAAPAVAPQPNPARRLRRHRGWRRLR